MEAYQLKGSSEVEPGNLFIDTPDKLKLVLNRKAPKAIDLDISKELLLRADQVLE